MRKKIHDQLPLMDTQVNHPRAREFEGISRILDAKAWNIAKSAKTLGIDRSTLYSKIKRYRIAKSD